MRNESHCYVPFIPTRSQWDALRFMTEHRHTIVHTPRRFGKSAMIVQDALFDLENFGANTLIACHDYGTYPNDIMFDELSNIQFTAPSVISSEKATIKFSVAEMAHNMCRGHKVDHIIFDDPGVRGRNKILDALHQLQGSYSGKITIVESPTTFNAVEEYRELYPTFQHKQFYL